MSSQLTVWGDPIGPFRTLFEELDRRRAESSVGAPWAPVADVVERPGEVVITAELPGVKDEDVHVHVGENAITISGERRLEEEVSEDHFRRIERSYGSFERRFPLPAGVDEDSVTAQVAYGVLRIVIPKPAKSGPRRVEITRGD